MSREEIYQLFINHLENRLPKDIHIQITNHLSKCTKCRIAYEDVADFFDEEKNEYYEHYRDKTQTRFEDIQIDTTKVTKEKIRAEVAPPEEAQKFEFCNS